MDQKSLRYTPSHEWARVEGDLVTVGITQYAAEQLTDVTALEIKPVGTKLEAGKQFGEIESVKAVFDLNAPVTGELVEVNQAVINNPSLVTDDPFGGGWMIKVRLAGGAGLDHLKSYEEYQDQLAQEEH